MNVSMRLVVEGPNDKHVLFALVAYHNFKPEFVIKDEEGLPNLLLRLPAQLMPTSGLDRLGIIIDADAAIRNRWESIKKILEKAGYSDVPVDPDPNGTVIDHEFLPRVGVWIMPDNSPPGMLEDYLTYLVPGGDRLFARANQVLDEIPKEERRFADHHRSKALLHTWLAWQEDPGTPLGWAITKRYFTADSHQVTKLISWLTRLFA